MASQPPPNGPGRGVSQLYPTPSVIGGESQAPPADTPARSVSQLYPSTGTSHAQTLKAPSKAPSAIASSQSRQQSVRPSQAPPHQASIRASQTPYSQATIRPSHAATLRGASQAPSHQPSIKPSHAATLRGPSQAPLPHTSTRGASQYHTTSSRMSDGESSPSANNGATELRRDVSRQPTIMLQTPSDHKTLLQRDTATITQRQSAQPTLLQRDASKMPSSMPTIKQASKAPTINPSKNSKISPASGVSYTHPSICKWPVDKSRSTR